MSFDINTDVIDHSTFDSLWRASKQFGKIRTTAVVDEPYKRYQAALATADPGAYFVNSRLAFWVNAYLASLMWVMHYRVGYRSTLWDSLYLQRDTFLIAGSKHTLLSLSDSIVSTAKTVRARSFLCTGSSNDPPFPSGACFAKTVIAQMREQLRRVVRSEKFVFYDPAGITLQLSGPIGEWTDGMINESGSIVDFLIPWVSEPIAAQLALHKDELNIVVGDRIERWRRSR